MIIPSWFGFIFNFCNLALICPQTIRESKLGELIWKGGNELKLLTNLIISTYCFLFHNISESSNQNTIENADKIIYNYYLVKIGQAGEKMELRI